MKRLLVLAPALTMWSCVSQQEPWAPSTERRPLTIDEANHLKTWLKMNDPSAPQHFVRDLKPLEGHTWRWTGKNPTIMLAAPKASGVRFAAEITVSDLTFKDTGPIAIKVTINGHELTTERYDAPGPKRIDKPVPDAVLKTTRENIVSMEVDKVWTSPIDGNRMGFVLTALGFIS